MSILRLAYFTMLLSTLFGVVTSAALFLGRPRRRPLLAAWLLWRLL